MQRMKYIKWTMAFVEYLQNGNFNENIFVDCLICGLINGSCPIYKIIKISVSLTRTVSLILVNKIGYLNVVIIVMTNNVYYMH